MVACISVVPLGSCLGNDSSQNNPVKGSWCHAKCNLLVTSCGTVCISLVVEEQEDNLKIACGFFSHARA